MLRQKERIIHLDQLLRNRDRSTAQHLQQFAIEPATIKII
jgi:hypothetical protein